MKQQLLVLLSISRPRFWLYLAGPFVVGYVAGIPSAFGFLSLQFWVLLLYFLLPANLFLYGINDLADQDTDQFNAKKGTYENRLSQKGNELLIRIVWGIIIASAVLSTVLLPPLAALLVCVFLSLGFAYSHKPFRWKARPVIDSTSNILYVVPGILGYFLASGEFPRLEVIVAAGLWSAAMHLYSAIPDISADSKAHLKTTAVILGKDASLWLCSALWLLPGILTLLTFQYWWLLTLGAYAIIPLLSLVDKWQVASVYRVFPYLNAAMGLMLFWSIFLLRFYS